MMYKIFEKRDKPFVLCKIGHYEKKNQFSQMSFASNEKYFILGGRKTNL